MNPHRILMGTTFILWAIYAVWTINTPEQEPECQKPIPQLSEILK